MVALVDVDGVEYSYRTDKPFSNIQMETEIYRILDQGLVLPWRGKLLGIHPDRVRTVVAEQEGSPAT